MKRKQTNYTVKFRRRREGRTNYKKRMKLLLSESPRLVIRRTNKHIISQIISFDTQGDKILASYHSLKLKKLGWNHSTKNLPAAYLTGYALGTIALKNGSDSAVLDTGLNQTVGGSKIFAAVKGAIDAGLKVPCSDEILPKEDRIKGKHISDYNKKHSSIVADFDNMKKMLKTKQ